MTRGRAVRDLLVFVSFYLVLSLPPFLYFNPETLRDVSTLATFAVVGMGVLLLASTLVFLDRGVDRHLRALVTPTDALSVVVELAFVAAAVSWWFVPELSFRLGWELDLGVLVVVVLAFHLPLILVLSLLTALSQAHG